MRVQYIHDHIANWGHVTVNKDDKKTFYFILPEYDLIETELMKLVTDSEYVPNVSIQLGIARCHPKDQYVKSVGRDIATSNVKSVNYVIEKVEISNRDRNNLIVDLSNESSRIKLLLKKDLRLVRVMSIYEK